MHEQAVTGRARRLFDERRQAMYRRTDRLFAALLALQWVAAVLAFRGWKLNTEEEKFNS